MAASNSNQHFSGTGLSAAASGIGGAFKLIQPPAALSSSLQYSSRGAGRNITELKVSQRIGFGGPPLYKVGSPGKPIYVNRNFKRSGQQ